MIKLNLSRLGSRNTKLTIPHDGNGTCEMSSKQPSCPRELPVRLGSLCAARLLPLLLLLLLMSRAAVLGQSYTDNYGTWGYESTNGTIVITHYTGPGGSVTIPGIIDGLTVAGIYAPFYGNSTVTNVTLPQSITSIGNSAFYGCSGLAGITIPSSVTNIGVEAFANCAALTRIDVDAYNPFYSSVDGVVFDKSQDRLIFYPYGRSGNYTIPFSVTSLGDSAFYGCPGLTGVTLPITVTNIGNLAFCACPGLTSVTVGGGASIEYGAFYNCYELASVTIGNGAIGIGDSAFYNCYRLAALKIPDTVTNIGNYVFYGCRGLSSVTIGNSVTTIGDSAFFGCSGLTNISIPSSLNNISNSAFDWCNNLTNVTIAKGVTSINVQAFVNCVSLSAITVDALNAVYSSVDGVLFNKSKCMLILYPPGKRGVYSIPASVTIIAGWAFENCQSQSNMIIPASVTSIEAEAFANCRSQNYIFLGNAPAVDPSALPAGNATIYYLAGTSGWTTFSSRLPTSLWDSQSQLAYTITNATITITGYTGAGGPVTIPPTIIHLPVTTIGADAFFELGLTSLMIPNSVTSIGDQAFFVCSGLTNVTIPYSVTNIGVGAFASCRGLTSVAIPGSVASIGDQAFNGCSGLASITIPNSVTSIGGAAFSYCTSLTNILIGNGVTNIGDQAFSFCSDLTAIMLDALNPSYERALEKEISGKVIFA